MLLLDGVNDIAVPEDHVAGVDLRNRGHARFQFEMRMECIGGTRTDEAFVATIQSGELGARDV